MKKALAGLVLLAAAPAMAPTPARATGVDLALGNTAASIAVLFNPYQFYAGGGSELALGAFTNEAGDRLAHATLLARGYRRSGNSQYSLGAGIKAVYGDLEIGDDLVIDDEDSEQVGALALGVQAGVLLSSSRSTPVEFIGEAFLAPSIASFTDAERYLELAARLQIEVIPQARVYLGYRRLTIDTNDYDSLNIDSGFHVGLKVTF